MPPPAKRGAFDLIYDGASALLPGLLATVALASLAVFGGKLLSGSGASPLMIAVLLGIAARAIVGAPMAIREGAQFAQKRLLRVAIILLGVQLTFADITDLSATALGVIAASVVGTYVFTCWAGRMLGVDRGLNRLIAAGASICGISAIVATNTVVKASDEDVTYAIATATAFGSASIFLYPLLATAFSLDPSSYAIWVGASVHEVAQVVAAGFVYGDDAGELAVLVKLTRVLTLVPMVLAIGWLSWMEAPQRTEKLSIGETIGNVPLPLFIFGFIAMIGVNSLDLIPDNAKSIITFVSAFLFAMALVALGLETDLKKLRQSGLRPFVAGILAWLFIASFSLALLRLLER